MKPMRHGSLFSGIGAAEIAAEMLGWENVFHCEINPFGRQVLDYWFPNSASYEDITKTDFSQYRGLIDVLTGGFPCQPFSYAGKRGGQEDDRYLWQEMLRVVEEVRPMWVIGENVNGITTMVESFSVAEMGCESSLFDQDNGIHRYQSEQTFTIERICRDLESKGYSVQPMLIPACAVGAPHRRDRIFILAYNVADSHSGDDMRDSGEHESESRSQRIQERNEVWQFGESSDVRSEMCGLAEDTLCDGCGCRQEEEPRSEWNKRDSRTGDGEWVHREKGIFSPSDTESKRLERQNKSGSEEGGEWMHLWRDIAGYYRKTALRPQERWKAFPTISPVSRGNDGIPFNVDSLTISRGQWRTETIKAYGNAIVPQVMYQIMKCINELTKQ